MLKNIAAMLFGAFMSAAVGGAFALLGTQPQQSGDEALINQQWLYNLAAGNNWIYQNTLTAHAGGTQAACLNLPTAAFLIQISTVATSGDSVCLPFAGAGDSAMIANAGANPVSIYAQSGTNLLTATTDTINGTTNTSAYSVTNATNAICFAPKNGTWYCIKGS
jgi:hypothetical protein